MAEGATADVLVFIAHPDDEVFVSGTLLLCANQGLVTWLVCATDGEGGSLSLLEPGEGPDELGRVRRGELRCSAQVLGAAGLEFLAASDVPPEGWDAGEPWDIDAMIAAMARIIRARRPQVIFSHGPRGGYGHPAHCCVSRCVMAAVEKCGFQGSVYAFCGQVSGAFYSWRFDSPSDVVVDVRGFLEQRSACLSCHRTEAQFFLGPYAPQTARHLASTILGGLLWFTEWGRKRLPVITPERFFRRFPAEGLALLRPRPDGRPDFFTEHFAGDRRVRLTAPGAG